MPNDRVFVYPLDSDSSTPGRIGTVTTDASGAWSFTLPAKLPFDSQAEANRNGGWLNVIASAFGADASGDPTEADGPTFAWTGQGTPSNITTSTLDRSPMIMVMGPQWPGNRPSQGLSSRLLPVGCHRSAKMTMATGE